MNYKIGIIALVALQAYAVSAQRPCVCARNFRPVCGSDGQTYSNDCRLECEKYNVKSDLVKVSEGPCDGALSPICFCTMEYSPVCGSDGVTYPNRCALQCKLSKNPRLYIEHEGECADKVKVVNIPQCTCTDNLQEVCGSDGKTYANDCLLNCATANDHSLSISHQGKCGNVNVVGNLPVQPPCTCPRSGNPVCGSNGQTYSNDCLLNCATANDPSLRISHFGACGQVNVANNDLNGCTCSRNLEPVCGSDGITYNNICLLQCAGQSVAKYRAC